MGQQTNEKRVGLASIKIGEGPIFAPVTSNLDNETNTDNHLLKIVTSRQKEQETILDDLRVRSWLAEMPIMIDVRGFIQDTERIEELFNYSIETYIRIISELLDIVEESYVTKDKYDDLESRHLELQKRYFKEPLNREDKMDNKMKEYIEGVEKEYEQKYAEGHFKKADQVRGFNLSQMRKIVETTNFNSEEQELLKQQVKIKGKEIVRRIESGMDGQAQE